MHLWLDNMRVSRLPRLQSSTARSPPASLQCGSWFTLRMRTTTRPPSRKSPTASAYRNETATNAVSRSTVSSRMTAIWAPTATSPTASLMVTKTKSSVLTHGQRWCRQRRWWPQEAMTSSLWVLHESPSFSLSLETLYIYCIYIKHGYSSVATFHINNVITLLQPCLHMQHLHIICLMHQISWLASGVRIPLEFAPWLVLSSSAYSWIVEVASYSGRDNKHTNLLLSPLLLLHFKCNCVLRVNNGSNNVFGRCCCSSVSTTYNTVFYNLLLYRFLQRFSWFILPNDILIWCMKCTVGYLKSGRSIRL